MGGIPIYIVTVKVDVQGWHTLKSALASEGRAPGQSIPYHSFHTRFQEFHPLFIRGY